MDKTLLTKALGLCFMIVWLSTSVLLSQNPTPGNIANIVAAAKSSDKSFAQVSFFKKQNATLTDKNVQQAVSEATLLTLDKDARNLFLKSAPEALELELPYKNGTLELELVRHKVLTDDFTVITSASNGEPVPYTPGVFYQGILKGKNKSVATLSVFKDEVAAIISMDNESTLVLGRIEEKGNEDDYILYADEDLLGSFSFECHADELPMPKMNSTPSTFGPINAQKALPQCVRQFLEADYALYQNKGSVTATVNFLALVFAEVKTLFNNEPELADLGMYLSQVYVWVSQDYYSTSSSSTALAQFETIRTTFTGDLAHLCALGGNNIGGIAYRPAICPWTSPYGYSNIDDSYLNVPTYSWTVEVLTHELGHNHGAPHTHSCVWGGNRDRPIDCCGPNAGFPEASCGGSCTNPIETPGNPGTIMSYCHLGGGPGISFTEGFHEQVVDTMVYYHNTEFNCLSANCPSYSCDSVINVTVTNIGDDEFTLNWSSVSGATAYNIQYKINGASTWTNGNTTATTFTIKNLSADTTYSAQVQTVCGGNSSAYSTGIIVRTLDACPPQTSNTESSANPVCSGDNFTLSMSQAYAAGYAFQWQSSPTNSGYTDIGGATSSTYVTNQSSSTWYRCEISCSGQSIYSTGLEVTMEANFMNCHCTPGSSACSGGATIQIDEVQLDVLNNANNACSTNGYGDYTSGQSIPTLTAGTGNYLQLNIDDPSYTQLHSIFIDFNQDGDMDDPDEEIQLPNMPGSADRAGVINVPASALPGNTRMRIRGSNSGYAADACSAFSFGETEDYTINIAACTGVCYDLPQVTDCDIGGGNFFRIERVQFGTLDNNNASCTDMIGYNDYTTGQNVPTITQGATPTITVTIGNFQQRVSVYIDFNGDGDFSDAGEETQLPFSTGAVQTGTVAVPAGATIGNTRMRIRSQNQSAGYPPNAYDGYDFGESEDYIVTIASALPVELIDFTASLNDRKQVDLEWATASETNTSHFWVERSRDGTNYEPLRQVTAEGDTQDKQIYSAMDERPFYGINYYRLRIVDLDGSESYSPVRSVQYQPTGFALVEIFPNPANEVVKIRYQADEEQMVQFKLADVTGRIVGQFKNAAVKGENLEQVEIADLPSGIYFISIDDGISEITERFVKW